jgi:hypothetical protein
MHRKINGNSQCVDWCTKIPLNTPLARLVTADPGSEMIEHDLLLLHKSERLSLQVQPGATVSI